MNCDTEQPSTSNQTETVFPKASTKALFTIDPSRIPKNDDKTVFYSNFLYRSLCFLCGVNDKNLATHYARKHPDTEVFIARVSPPMAKRIREQQYNFIRIDDEIHGLCFFCEEMQAFGKDDWMKHLLLHTGEQPYFCSGCETSMVRKINHGKCSKDEVQHIFGDTASDSDLTGFICNTCNYLQIRENQMIDHMVQHDTFIEISGKLFSSVILVKISST